MKPRWSHYTGIFLISLATLLLELSLTRILSISFFYHFGYLVISTALLGFGLAGTVLSIRENLQKRADIDSLLATLSLGFALSAVLGYIVCQQIPFNPFNAFGDPAQFLLFPLYFMILLIPFFFSGLIIALLFTHASGNIHRLYAWDLCGAGLGCALALAIMPLAGGVGAIPVIAGIASCAAFMFALPEYRSRHLAYPALAIIMLALAVPFESWFPVRVTRGKQEGFSGKPIYSAWNTISKIDVFTIGPGERSTLLYPDSLRLIVFDQGTAASEILNLQPDAGTYIERLRQTATLTDTIRMFTGPAFINHTAPRVFILGSGGGEEVMHALYYRAAQIDAVEINPAVNRLITRDMADYAGKLAGRPEVRFFTEDGRRFIERSGQVYDIIISVYTISKAATASGALSLAEDYALTIEAFQAYWDHLSEDGVILFTRPKADLERFVATLRQIMDTAGVTHPERHLIIFGNGLLFKKSPFSTAEVRRVEYVTGNASKDITPYYSITYSPLRQDSASTYHQILHSENLPALYATLPEQIAPATDDRPFFSHKFRWSSLNLAILKGSFSFEKDLWGELNARPVAELLLLFSLIQSIVIAAVLILLPLLRYLRAGTRIRHAAKYLFYFSGLGAGFIMLEMALLQKYLLYLGQPIYTYAIILGSLLIYTGAGAYLVAFFPRTLLRTLRIQIPVICLMLLIYALFLPVIFSATMQFALTARIWIASASLLPLGIMLGIPFPGGLTLLGQRSESAFVPWAWGVNSFFTVIGTGLALIIGMSLGFTAVVFIAGCCYGLAWVMMLMTK
ncbi:MAG: hypothetical protein KDH97_16625 [Calditrichaeota bacterium]|nr:hypothetical protein [Calditrichota bacterium]MCB0291881.1 hypothetical protein [Calditrichota bacterium]MCB0297258.1 hypothetical protein [Calditrichota bacterium]MCB0306824.1 hypothetical protein [Calditrichota bacterium]MCB0316732.1 hypothetical protein [Calditrichota bacterium]